MGNILSRLIWGEPEEQQPVLDGLGFSANTTRDFDVKAAREKLHQLLRASIVSYRLSSIAQPLTAAFYLGATPQDLTNLFELWVPTMCEVWPDDDPVSDSIGKFNLEEFYGKQAYEERYYDYFRDCLTEERDWPPVVKQHMDQLGSRLANNHFRPLLELTAALESDNAMIAVEALAMACTDPTVPEVSEAQTDHLELVMLIRDVARSALQSGDSRAVNIAHAQCELFLSEKERLVPIDLEVSLLRKSLQYTRECSAGKKLPAVDAATALESKDPDLIQYTRARIILEKIAL